LGAGAGMENLAAMAVENSRHSSQFPVTMGVSIIM